MSDLRILSVSGDVCGEAALSYLPARGEPPGETLMHANGVTGIDAWGAVALRMSIEFYARYQSQQVTVSQPLKADMWRLLYHLLCQDCPRHLRLSDDSNRPGGSAPRTIVLTSQRVVSEERGYEAAALLLGSASGRMRSAMRFLASQLPGLVFNSITHGADSPIAPVACVCYDREEDQLQLVVGDLGSTFADAEDAGQALRGALDQRGEDGTLLTAVDSAAARGIDASLTLASGNGRVYWRQGQWSRAEAIAVPGFVAALTVQLD